MSLYEFFYTSYNSDVLLQFVRLLGGRSNLTRKDQRAEFLVATLLDPERLRAIWQEMDDLSHKAVTEAYHNGGVFDANAFVAQYGSVPERPKTSYGYYVREPILFDLFVHFDSISRQYILEPALMPILAGFIPERETFRLEGLVETPTTIGADAEEIDTVCAETEEAGWHDLLLFLQLLDAGMIKLSSSSTRLTPVATRTFLDNLLQGDFFTVDSKAKADDTIRAYGLPQFAAGAGLISTTGSGNLTERGREFLATQEPSLLLEAFETWINEGNFDELNRIDALKGMRSRNIRLTKPGMRRERIVEALSWCPTGEWILIDDFYRALKIWHFDFELEEGGIEKLYIGYRYGSSGYYEPWASQEDMWALTNGLYINVVLWEYLASIGALDLLYVSPEDVDLDVELYYYDEFAYSRYDGLLYFRINPLGAYLFGQAGEYTPKRPVDEAFFTVTPDRKLTLLGDPQDSSRVTPVVKAQLDQYFVAETAESYRLDAQKLLEVLDEGADYGAMRDFLTRHHHGSLPAEIDTWLDQTYVNSQAFSIKSQALLIRVASVELVEQVLADGELGKFCNALDTRTLVIPTNRESRFRSRLHELGYGMR